MAHSPHSVHLLNLPGRFPDNVYDYHVSVPHSVLATTLEPILISPSLLDASCLLQYEVIQIRPQPRPFIYSQQPRSMRWNINQTGFSPHQQLCTVYLSTTHLSTPMYHPTSEDHRGSSSHRAGTAVRGMVRGGEQRAMSHQFEHDP